MLSKRNFVAIVFICALGFLFHTSSAHADSVLFSNSFEEGYLPADGWVPGSENVWTTLSGGAHIGQYRAYTQGIGVPIDGTLTRHFSVAGYTSVTISYWYQVNKSLNAREHLYVELGYGCCNWRTLADYTDLASGSWTFASHTVAVPPGADEAHIRFHTHLERDNGVTGISVDDVSGVGTITVPPDPVIIIPGILGSWTKDGTLVIDPVLHTYDDLIETLEANGYTMGKDLFTFPYEWRNSNITSAYYLKDKIAAVKAICGCTKVDLVAHSMGGLVARQYIQSPDLYQHDVDQLIFLGTPHLGSTDSYLTWEGGEVKPGENASAMKFLFKQEAKKAGYSNIFSYVHDRVVSVRELLPITDYLRDKNTGSLRTFPLNYPQNNFLADLTAGTNSFLNSGVRISNFIGDMGPTSTILNFRVIPSTKLPFWEHGFPENFGDKNTDQGLEMGNGDETVAYSSAGDINQDLTVLPSKHGKLPSDTEGLVYRKLTGKDATTLIHKDRGTSYKLLIVKILSPADIAVIAPDGKRIGKDFATGQEVNEIPDAFYSGFATDDEYITIPNPLDGEYRVETQGTGTGEYTVASGLITDTTSAEKDFTGATVPGATNELKVTVDNTNPDVLPVTPSDTTPPSITITSPTATTYLRSTTLTISANASDSSGVALTKYFFDGVPASPSVDLFFKKLGTHTVTVQATDTVNNTASKSVSFTINATYDSSISDTNRAYVLKWITTTRIRDPIIKDFQTARDNVRKRASTLSSLLSLLDTDLKKKVITQQAYDVLKEDVVWLQTH